MSGSSALLRPRRRRARGSGRTTLPGLRVVVGHPESQVCSFLGRRLTLGSQTAALLHPQPAPRERLSCALWLRCSVVSDAATPWTAAPRLLCPWDPPGKDTGVGCHLLLQGIFPTQGSNPDHLHCRWILYRPSHQGSSLWINNCGCITSELIF